VTSEQVIAALAGELPPVTLVLGPGAWDVVAARPPDPDWIRTGAVDAAMARQVRDMAGWAAPGEHRVIALNLDGASMQVQNMLLKVLEEPPGTTRFVLASPSRLLPTVMSRCRVLVLGQQDGERPAVDAAAKAAVGTAVRLAEAGQGAQLAQEVRGWKPEQARLLWRWAAEAASGFWQDFEPSLAPRVTAEQALNLMAELKLRDGAKLGPLVALTRVFCPQ
jgi:hypothetical protein